MSVELEIRGSTAWVTIARPERRNALDLAHQQQLDAAWRQVEADGEVRVAVLTGAGEQAFCAGADVKASADPKGAEYLDARLQGGFGGISLRRSLRVPVLARVNGAAIGGGFEMVLGCDLAIAAEHAVFALPEAGLGRVPVDGGVPLLARAVPDKVAREILLAGRRLNAAEALDLGLVNRVVPAARLDEATAELAERVLACAPLSQVAIKEMLAGSETMDRAAANAYRPDSLSRALGSKDGVEGAAAFREKREPQWKAR